MVKKVHWFVALVLLNGAAFGQIDLTGVWTEPRGTEFPMTITLQDGKITEESFDPTIGKRTTQTHSYKLTTRSTVPFIEYGNSRFILLNYSQKAIYLKGKDWSLRLYRNPKNGNIFNREFEIHSFKTTSELKEGPVHFTVDGLENGSHVWASGNGYGLHEKISFLAQGPLKAIYLGNGYLSFTNPNLYLENSRLKTFKLTNLLTKKERIFNLSDTIQPQRIDFKDVMDYSKKINERKIEILEVFPGSKYKDLCLWEIRKDDLLF